MIKLIIIESNILEGGGGGGLAESEKSKASSLLFET